MNYHNIVHNDMLNGEGLRTTLFVSGCSHNCKNCQNPQTHKANSGIKFDEKAEKEFLKTLEDDFIDGVTFSGGDPLFYNNRTPIYNLCKKIKKDYPAKTIWLYTGYRFEDIKDLLAIKLVDVLVDGKFIEELKDENYHWAGSINQRVIDVQKSLKNNEVILYEEFKL